MLTKLNSVGADAVVDSSTVYAGARHGSFPGINKASVTAQRALARTAVDVILVPVIGEVHGLHNSLLHKRQM